MCYLTDNYACMYCTYVRIELISHLILAARKGTILFQNVIFLIQIVCKLSQIQIVSQKLFEIQILFGTICWEITKKSGVGHKNHKSYKCIHKAQKDHEAHQKIRASRHSTIKSNLKNALKFGILGCLATLVRH